MTQAPNPTRTPDRTVTRLPPNPAVPGDRTTTLKLWSGQMAQPPLTTATARWNWRQAQNLHDIRLDNRAILGILNALMNELTPNMQQLPFIEIRNQIAKYVESGQKD
jgi:hypothetical protein